MAVSSTWILSLKILLISTGVVSMAIMLKISVPFITDCVFYQIPLIWAVLVSWLRPPYLYFVINGIIITIAATSRFHHKADNKSEPEPLVSSKPPPSDLPSDYAVPPQPEFGIVTAMYGNETTVSEVNTVVINGPEDDESEDPLLIARSMLTPPEKISTSEIQSDYLVPSPGKPLVSSRFGHRKPLKASPEGGRSLRVAKPKRQETLESTWKAITDGRHVPLTRHLKKSDSWENHGRQFDTSPQEQYYQQQIVKKSETFQDSTNHGPPSMAVNSSPVSGKLRKEPSLSQDELNRRVEAFIKKFNEEMRLQRQQSLNQYKEMIDRGAH